MFKPARPHRRVPDYKNHVFVLLNPHLAAGVNDKSTPSKLVQPQHAAACRSMPQHLFFGAAHGGFEACRSMPQHAAACRSDPKFSRGGLFFSYHVETVNPLLHSCLRTGWQLSGKLLGSRFEGPGFHSRKGYFAACQFLSIVALIFAFLVLF